MSDPLRTEGSRAPDAGPNSDRDAKIEQLLLAGLDHYFANEYEQAAVVLLWIGLAEADESVCRCLVRPRAKESEIGVAKALAEMIDMTIQEEMLARIVQTVGPAEAVA